MELSIQPTYTHQKQAIALLLAMHVVGFIGLQTSISRPLFELLVPFNLLLTALIVCWHQKGPYRPFLWFFTLAFLTGYSMEWLGVHTGWIFGSYQYGDTLGWKLSGIPLVIGVNWFVLAFSSGVISERLANTFYSKVIIGGFLMVGLDYFIEPVAIRHDFWAWNQISVPWLNYLGWFLISLALLAYFHKSKTNKDNPVAFALYWIQLGFFLSHNVTYLKIFEKIKT